MRTEPEIIAETPHIIAVAKPAGCIVHRDGRNLEPSLTEWIVDRYPELAGIGGAWISPQGEEIPLNGAVHRLDKPTSGVILFARDAATFMQIKREFKERRIEKEYAALVMGHTPESGMISARIERSSGENKRWYAIPCAPDHPRAAITNWSLLRHGQTKDGESVSLLSVQPLTGRTHQIRIHLAHAGYPIYGDAVYGEDAAKTSTKRLALHAKLISLTLAGERLTFEAPIPDDFPHITECSPK